MGISYSAENAAASLLRGAATAFDVSGTGVFSPEYLESDLDALRGDFSTIAEDFVSVVREEAVQWKPASGEQS